MKKQQQQHCALLSSLPLLSPLLSSPPLPSPLLRIPALPLLSSLPLLSPLLPCSPSLFTSPTVSSPPLPCSPLSSPPLPCSPPLLSSPSLLSPSVVDRGLLAANHPKPQPARTSKLTFREKNRRLSAMFSSQTDESITMQWETLSNSFKISADARSEMTRDQMKLITLVRTLESDSNDCALHNIVSTTWWSDR